MAFRFDRFLTLYFFHPLSKKCRSEADIKVPILMYHGISNSIHRGVHPYYETTTTPAVFAEQVQFLNSNRYRVVGLEELPGIFSMEKKKDTRFAVITFDDGLLNFYTDAFPVLNEFGFSATVFLPTGRMGRLVANQAVMSWEHARELMRQGVFFGSHSVSHPRLVELEVAEVEREIRDSKKELEAKLGRKIRSFSYPYAFPDNNWTFMLLLEKLLSRYGYELGVTTMIGNSSMRDNRLFLKRLPVNHHDDMRFFRAKLEGGYDWLHSCQSLSKKARLIAGAC
jgi:peptidoglycan/xylan/chitin deacetylase (PgdA/CDA1 family)